MLGAYRVLDVTDRLGWLAGRLLADLGAEVVKIEPSRGSIDSPAWRAYNVNKRLLRLDLETVAGKAAFERLLRRTDVLLDSAEPAGPFADYLAAAQLGRLNPRLVHVSITPFGSTGPRSAWQASDLELMAAGGAMSLAGEPDGVPLRITVPQSPSWAGAQAAVGALIALIHRSATDRGERVDVSAQAAVMLALSHAPAFWDLEASIPSRAGAFITGRSLHGARFRAFWPCADGYLNFAFYGGAAGQRTNVQLVDWMRGRGAALGALATVDWSRFDPKLMTQEQVDALERPAADFFRGITRQEFLEETSRREMLGYPVWGMRDIASDAQLEARGFWQTPAGDSDVRRRCGSAFVIDGVRQPLRYRAGKEVLLPDLLSEFETGESPPHRPCSVAPRTGAIPQALAGLRVLEFGAYAAGPHIGKMLAAFGATVVHVESRQRPDGFRVEYPPFKGGRAEPDRSGCFAYFNDSKLAITLNLKAVAGADLARRLMSWSDIVVENMRPGVMARLGLGYETVRSLNPRVVMLSTCNMGQTGPRAHMPGFGSQLSALAGFCGLTGMADGSPMLLYGPYIDFIASTIGATAVLAAVDRQRSTGQGACIDLSQYEAGLMFMAEALLQYQETGIDLTRAGNTDPRAAPHDAYRCAGNTWVAISCWSDAEFGRLIGALERPDLAADPRFATLAARQQHLRELTHEVERWTARREADEAAARLQAAGVHAHRVNAIADLFRDPQLGYRRIWRRRRHPVMGEVSCFFSAFDLAGVPGDVTAAGPRLGADNEYVIQELLGMTTDEYAACAAQGAFD